MYSGRYATLCICMLSVRVSSIFSYLTSDRGSCISNQRFNESHPDITSIGVILYAIRSDISSVSFHDTTDVRAPTF